MLSTTRAELTKIISLRTVWIVVAAIVALHLLVSTANVGLNADAVSKITTAGIIEIFEGEPQPAHQALVDMLVASSFQMGLFLPGIAAVAAGQEFRSNQLGMSLLAVPRRGRLMVGKTFAIGGFLLFISIVIAAISTAFMYVAVKDWDPGLPLSADAWLGQGKFVAFAVLTGLVTFALTMIARSTIVGIIVTVALIALTMTQLLAALTPALDALLPLSAGRNLLLNPAYNKLSAGPQHALIVLASWPLVSTAVAWIALDRRDAR